jgi:hypothetical protein
MFFCDLAKNEYSTPIRAGIVAKAFGIQDSHVWTILSKIQNKTQRSYTRLPLKSPSGRTVIGKRGFMAFRPFSCISWHWRVINSFDLPVVGVDLNACKSAREPEGFVIFREK